MTRNKVVVVLFRQPLLLLGLVEPSKLALEDEGQKARNAFPRLGDMAESILVDL